MRLRRQVEARGSNGDEFFTKIAEKVIIDCGCGEGADAVEIGIDIREDVLQAARQKALTAGVHQFGGIRRRFFVSECDDFARAAD